MSTGVEALYPFLYPERVDRGSVREDVRRSTVTKVDEIGTLRRDIEATHGAAIVACARAMAERFRRGGRLFAFGNGGSSSDAQAVVQLFCTPRIGQALPAVALTNNVAALTALANDVGFDVVFARQIAAFARPDDIAMGLSTSGGSANVLRGFDEAGARGLLTIGLAGYDGGAMAELGKIDHLFVVPSSSVHRIQEAQTTIYDVLWELTIHALAG